jgi:hypothetical protein
MSANKKLCCCDDCLNKSDGQGKYVHHTTWSRHQKKKSLFEELENDIDDDDFLISVDNEMTGINYNGILKNAFCFFFCNVMKESFLCNLIFR